MTPEQIELARHALGLGRARHVTYRNHFVTGPGSPDWPAWEAMVAEGVALRRGPVPVLDGDYCFHLTMAGAQAALRPGESLDPEFRP